MLFTVVILALAALVTSQKTIYDNYKVFRIVPSSIEQLEVLRQLEDVNTGLMFWTEPSVVSREVDLMVAPSQLDDFMDLMNDTDTKYEVYIDNVQKLIDQERSTRRTGAFGWTSYHTLEEIYSWLESLQVKYPEKVEVIVAGKTYEGREIKGVKVTFGEDKPGVFIEGGIHAREWISPATVTYILNEFLESEDPEIRALAESYNWYFVPSFNPDGYVFTHTKNRLWRKTLSKTSTFCKGVDPNRNYNFKWNAPGGSSKNPCAEDFSGKFAFSEIETNSTAHYLKSISDKLFAYISFHSYSQLLLLPYGYTTEHLDNFEDTYSMSLKAVEALAKRYGTKYRTGATGEIIYIATGCSMDWVKGVLKLPISMTYELRDTGRHGFLLPANQIIPTGEEIIDSLVALFKEATRLGYPKEA